MDGLNSNASDRFKKKKFKRPNFNAKIKQFSIEIYFMWFSALIFLTETIVDLWLVCYYFLNNEFQNGIITLSILVVPAVICQIYSLWLLRSDNNVSARALMLHILLLGIPYRYHNILHKIATKHNSNTDGDQNVELIIDRIRDVNAIQTVNAIFQYCPQFIFQSFLIIYRHYTYLMTGVSAGLACFSFLWHIFIHFFYLIRRFNEDYRLNDYPISSNGPVRSTTHIIDNLSTSVNTTSRSLVSHNSLVGTSIERNVSNSLSSSVKGSSLSENYKNFEKPSYQMDFKNFVPLKKNSTKHVEKSKIFGFNKRRPIYEKEEFDMMCEASNLSTVFFEINDTNCLTSSKLENATASPSVVNQKNVNQSDSIALSKSMESLGCSVSKKIECHKISSSTDNLKYNHLTEANDEGLGCSESMLSILGSRNSLLKRKGICSSQEMLHLVDIMSDNISAEQVDVLSKSLIELGGAGSLKTESEHEIQDHVTLLEQFSGIIDDKILENIDAAIYENQIIFQERIRKNQLTIQNLKLQDQLLSKCIEDFKLIPSNETMSIRDYENMCFANVARQHRGMKHWRNYLQINDTQHDNSTIQNTISNACTDDLYINENDLLPTPINQINKQFSEKSTRNQIDAETNDSITSPDVASTIGDESMLIPCYKKIVQWQTSKLPILNSSNISKCSCDEESSSEKFYVNMTKTTVDDVHSMTAGVMSKEHCEKNILVETINKINIVDSPIKSLMNSDTFKQK